MKNSNDTSGTTQVNFQVLVKCLKQLHHHVPQIMYIYFKNCMKHIRVNALYTQNARTLKDHQISVIWVVLLLKMEVPARK